MQQIQHKQLIDSCNTLCLLNWTEYKAMDGRISVPGDLDG